MPIVAQYKFHVNALYMQECLANNGITSVIQEPNLDQKRKYALDVSDANCNIATQLIEETPLDEDDISLESDGHLDNYAHQQIGTEAAFYDEDGTDLRKGLLKGSVWKNVYRLMIYFVILSLVSLLVIATSPIIVPFIVLIVMIKLLSILVRKKE